MNANALNRLEDWSNKHKARSFNIERDNGYGSNPCLINLIGESGEVCAVESWSNQEEIDEFSGKLCIQSVEHDYASYYVKTAASDKTLWVEKLGFDGWAGLERTIHAAIDAYEVLEKEKNECK